MPLPLHTPSCFPFDMVRRGLLAGVSRRVLGLSVLSGLLAAGTAAAVTSFEPGDRLPDLTYSDIEGHVGRLSGLSGLRGLVLITRDTECPVSQRYVLRIAELAKTAGARGFNFAVLDVTPHSRTEAQAAAAMLPGIVSLFDPQATLAIRLRANSTAEAFLIDRAGMLRYRGAIDDQYGFDSHRAAPRQTWLRDALFALDQGQEPKVKRTEARGCALPQYSDSK